MATKVSKINVGLVCINEEIIKSYKRLYDDLPDGRFEFAHAYKNIGVLLDSGIKYEVIVVYSWLGYYVTQLNQNTGRLPKVVYLHTSVQDKLPPSDPNMVILYLGKVNASGLLQAFTDLNFI